MDLEGLIPSWRLALAAERKAAGTIRTYTTAVRLWLTWCEDNGRAPELTRACVTEYIATMGDAGAEGSTMRIRQTSIRLFAKWLAAEGEIDRNELAALPPVRLDDKLVQPLSDDQLRALLKACEGKRFIDVRDMAIVRLFVDSGARASELVDMNVDDVTPGKDFATIRKGKGGKGRLIPLGPDSAVAIDRWLRLRRTHRLADTSPRLWLGDRGKKFTYDGLRATLTKRGEVAGIPDFHAHLMRHSFANRWLEKDGSESGLMAVAGWTRYEMLGRYTRARAAARAIDEAKRLSLGDL